MERSESIAALSKALAAAQGEIIGAGKDAFNPHFKAKYADLAAVWDACRPALAKNGLAVIQPVSADGARVRVITLLAHGSGEWISEELILEARDASPQSVGSVFTYGRRYGLSAMVGVAPDDDDDGNAAQPTRNGSSRDSSRPSTPQPAEARPSEYISGKQQGELIRAAKATGWTDAALATFVKDNYRSWDKVPVGEFSKVMATMQGGTEPAEPTSDINDGDASGGNR